MDAIDAMMASGTAHSGMVAKLAACRHALDGGVTDVSIVAGRGVCDFDGGAAAPRIDRSRICDGCAQSEGR